MVTGAVRRLASWLAAVFAVLTIVGEVPAWAKDATARATVVLIIEGGGGESLRNAVAGALPGRWAPADPAAVAAAAKNRKLPTNLSALEDEQATDQYIAKLAQVTVDVGANAAVIAQ